MSLPFKISGIQIILAILLIVTVKFIYSQYSCPMYGYVKSPFCEYGVYNAYVTIKGDGYYDDTYTDGWGFYYFSDVPQGWIHITASHPAWSDVSEDFYQNCMISPYNPPQDLCFEPPGGREENRPQLFQNYPNPFNPKTNIKYSIVKNNYVKLNVFNILGQEVSILVNENKNPGIYEVEFNASNLASGIYFYKITVGDFSEIKKMFVIK